MFTPLHDIRQNIKIIFELYVTKMVNYVFSPYFLHYISIWFIIFLIVLIWSLTFHYCISLVPAVISWMKIANMANDQNKKFSFR